VIQPALLGGLFIGIMSALPIVSALNFCCCCCWVIGGGLLSAYIDQQNHPQVPITAGRGAQVGLLAGVVGAFVWLVTARVLDLLLSPIVEPFIREVARNAADMPPEARAWLEALTSQGPRYLANFAFMLLAGAIFATLGGLIGGVYFRADVPPALGGPVPPPPLPPTEP
jgi:hypothetical protein